LLNENEIDLKPQDNLSYWGKILILNENNNSVQIFSKGHRNILGLYADNNIILSTENGPRGGDEINRIIYNKNYGWPIASYGAPYNSGSKTNYKKNHNEYYEPIYSFVPSIGISEIIKLDNNFAKEWEDNFLIGSLNDKHLLRVKFNDSFEKVLYIEKIFINERIRDIKYYNQKKIIFLALENTGSLGIIKNANP
jgi:glucose/arabinose dehydrogenase